jgi:hypothetical protein
MEAPSSSLGDDPIVFSIGVSILVRGGSAARAASGTPGSTSPEPAMHCNIVTVQPELISILVQKAASPRRSVLELSQITPYSASYVVSTLEEARWPGSPSIPTSQAAQKNSAGAGKSEADYAS